MQRKQVTAYTLAGFKFGFLLNPMLEVEIPSSMIDNLCSYRYNSLILERANDNPVHLAVSKYLRLLSQNESSANHLLLDMKISSAYRLIFV